MQLHNLPNSIKSILICSYCGAELIETENNYICSDCKLVYKYTDMGSLDLRLKKPKKYEIQFDIGTPLLPENEFKFDILPESNRSQVDFTGIDIPWHLTSTILSYFPKAVSPNSLMLDLGCGDAIHRSVCEHAGFEWVGLDYESNNAPILGDAHSLPFKENTFDFILSIAVLEHIQFPFVMMREAYRVLKPNGVFIGTVAFLESFHGNSFYHHTHLGTFNSLNHGGFKIEKISPSADWSVLVAQAEMSLFPKMPKALARSIVYPIQVFHKLWWTLGSIFSQKAVKNTRILNTTGAFTFVATKT